MDKNATITNYLKRTRFIYTLPKILNHQTYWKIICEPLQHVDFVYPSGNQSEAKSYEIFNAMSDRLNLDKITQTLDSH